MSFLPFRTYEDIMKKSLLIATLFAVAAMASVQASAAPKASPEDNTIVAVYAESFEFNGERLVRVETIGSRKLRNGTKIFVRDTDVPAHVYEGEQAPSTPAPATAKS